MKGRKSLSTPIKWDVADCSRMRSTNRLLPWFRCGPYDLTFARVLKSMLPEAGIIVASGRMEEREANQFKTLGVTALLDKPFTQEKLEEALKVIFPK